MEGEIVMSSWSFQQISIFLTGIKDAGEQSLVGGAVIACNEVIANTSLRLEGQYFLDGEITRESLG